MTSWLHFIGKSYYKTPGAFVREAQTHGVTRRISLKQLEAMTFGDRLVFAQRIGKSAIIFGTGRINGISGMSSEAVAAVNELTTGEILDMGGQHVVRECGSYTTGASVKLRQDTTLAELAAKLRDCKDPGKLMLMATFNMLAGEIVAVRCPDIPHSMGFRPFNWADFQEALQATDLEHLRGKPVVKGLFYATPGVDDTTSPDALIQAVGGYIRK